MSNSDLYVQDLRNFGSKSDLRQHSIRILRANANDVHINYEGLRTCHSCWGVYLAPGNELNLGLDNGKMHRVRDTDITIIPPWVPFQHVTARNGGRHCFILCALLHLPHAISQIIFDQVFRIKDTEIVSSFMSFADTFNEEHAPPALTRALQAQEIASRCFLSIIGNLSEEKRQLCLEPDRTWSRLQPVITYIQNELSNSISNQELAEILHIGTDHFTRLFKKHLHQTPVQYIISQRISRAAELLYSTDLNLDDIANRCGFPNRRYLSRRFSEQFGMPPIDFRKGHQ